MMGKNNTRIIIIIIIAYDKAKFVPFLIIGKCNLSMLGFWIHQDVRFHYSYSSLPHMLILQSSTSRIHFPDF